MTLAQIDPNRIGKQILSAQLERGFTVIRREERGETEYGLGVIDVGTAPFKPFQIVSSMRTLVNDRTEIHAGQQDVVSGFLVTGKNQALTITANIDGAAAVDLFLLSDLEGNQLLDRYVSQPGPVSLSMPPRFEDSIQYGTQWQRTIPVPEGSYQILFDNTKVLGRTAPAANVGDDRAVKVDYVVQVGDAP